MRPGDFNHLAGPWFLKDDGGELVGGFRVMKHHINPARTCHGGMLATFCDVYLAMAALYVTELPHLMLPTISLSLDFLEPAPAGVWVEGRAQLLRAGRRTIFVQGLLRVEDKAAVRANATFSVPPGDGGSLTVHREQLHRLLRGAA